MNHRNLTQALLLLALGALAGIAAAQEIKLELNKLEPQPETRPVAPIWFSTTAPDRRSRPCSWT